MNSHPTFHKLIAGTLLASFAVAAFAPAAEAGHGRGQFRKYRRFERTSCARRVVYAPQRVVEFRHTSHGGGSTLAGFIGGLAIGAILTSAAQSHASSQAVYEPEPAYCPPAREAYGYGYEDPYCHERFASLDLYLSHTRHGCSHPLIVRVIDSRDGDCVDVIRYNDGRWAPCDRGDYDNDWDD